MAMATEKASHKRKTPLVQTSGVFVGLQKQGGC
jgi:hypothetical protein